MKKLFTLLLAVLLVVGLAGCSSSKSSSSTSESTTTKQVVIAVPNDTTNEARALKLLADNGYITLPEGADTTATVADIVDNPYNIQFEEVEAAQLPNVLKDVDFAVINGNYAIEAGLNPTEDALLLEGSSSAYVNVLCCKEGNEDLPVIKAVVAALTSQQVGDYIGENYQDGSVVFVVENPTDGYDSSIDYDALKGTTVKVACSPNPHADILSDVVVGILAEKGITLEVVEFTDYVQPNTVVEDGTVELNYFQHVPYLEDFNAENGTHIVSVAGVHVEPMGLFAGTSSSLDVIK